MKLFLILFNIFCVLLVPVEALFFNIPAWVFVLALLVLSAADVFFLIRFSCKKREKILFPVFNVITVILLLYYSFCYPYFGGTVFKLKPHYYITNAQVTVSQKQALNDLNFIVKKLKHIHVALRKPDSAESQKINAAYENAVRIIKTKDNLTVVELAQQIESVLSVLGDAHTSVSLRYTESEHYYKEVYKHNENDDTFIEINGIPYKELLKQNSHLYSYEKESWALKDMMNHSISLEGLAYLNIDASKGVTYTFERQDGTFYTENATLQDYITYDEYTEYNHLNEKNTADEKPFCYYSIDEKLSLAIFTLNSCRNNAFYAETLNKMFTEIKEKNIKNLAIDVRNNGGGSSLVINNLFKYLNIDSFMASGMIVRQGPFMLRFKNPTKKNNKISDLLFTGNVFLLSSNSSFSSAMMFAQYVKDNKIGKIIGEAPGNDPNGYGEVVHFDLPESHIFVQISRKKFTRVNQDTDEVYVEPDYPCSPDKAIEILEELIIMNGNNL